MGTLTGKVALVTGSTRGIGRAIAARFLAEGASVAVHGKSPEAARSAAQELGSTAGTAVGFGADLAESAAAQTLVGRVMDEFGAIDIVVNNAGIARDRYLTRLSDEDWFHSMAVNLSAPFFLTRAAVGPMKTQASGVIINVLSWAGLRGHEGQAAYAASKAGLYGLTLTAAKELAGFGIRVNAISPIVETDMLGALTPEQRAAVSNPMRRFGTWAEVGEAAVFLATDRSSFTTGQVLHIDGGAHLI